MKKIFILALVLSISSCSVINFKTGTHVRMVTPEQLLSACPSGSTYEANAGNGWHLIHNPIGYYLVSIQGSVGAGTFVQMTYIGKELSE